MSDIVIMQGNEFKIMDTKIRERDVFLSQYKIAAKHVEEIVAATSNDNKTDHLNNIIAFTGERGQGKSSAMHTFTGALVKKDNYLTEILEFGTETKQKSFLTLGEIDPSTFEDMHNVLEVVVAKMFNSLSKKLLHEDKTEYKNIINKFQTVYECLTLIRNPKQLEDLENDYEGTLHKIAHIGDSTILKQHMCELVEFYISKAAKNEGLQYENCFLIIPIDDLDINVELAYKMSEQIRKYLLIPKVLIIMAVKVEQLKYCIELQYRKELKLLIEAPSRLNNQEPMSMAAKYVEKLIPDGRKIILPELRGLASNTNGNTRLVFLQKNSEYNLLEKYEELGIEKTILGYIYEKTGLIFIKPEDRVHPMVPNTLRELVNLMSVLGKMNDINKMNRGNENTIKNIEMFEDYMLNTWIPSNLDDGYVKRIRSFYFENPFEMHSILCQNLLDLLENIIGYTIHIKSAGEFDNIKTHFINMSVSEYCLGDVLTLLDFFEKRYLSNEVKAFVFAVKTLYSITMHKMVIMKSHTDLAKANDIYRFVNGDIWGKEIKATEQRMTVDHIYSLQDKKAGQLIRSIQKTTISRAVFNYNVDELFEHKLTSSDNDTTKMFSAKELSEQQIDLLCDVLFFSNFKDFKVFVSGNSQYRANLEFSIENLFISSLDIENISKKWGYQLPNRVKQYTQILKRKINANLAIDIVSNIELGEWVFKYCDKYKSLGAIKSGVTDIEHFNHFINNIIKAVKQDYLFNDEEEGIFTNHEANNWASDFYGKCVEIANKPKPDIEKNATIIDEEMKLIIKEFESIKRLGRICITKTLLEKIDKIKQFIKKNRKIQMRIERSNSRLQNLEIDCRKLAGADFNAKITVEMKNEYNAIYDGILGRLNM